jgi:hypothetical protein
MAGSAPLEAFAPLARVEGVELVSLQKGPGLDQVEALRGRFALTVPQGELGGEGGAFVDTAKLMKCLDLVVCVDTAVGHLAEALGVPVSLALSRLLRGLSIRQLPLVEIQTHTCCGTVFRLVGRIFQSCLLPLNRGVT